VIDVPVYQFSSTTTWATGHDLSINVLAHFGEDPDVKRHTEGYASDLSDVRTSRFRPGTYECWVAGIGHRPDAAQDPILSPGRPVRLEREPDNSYDSHAIRVMTPRGQHLGYIPRRDAEALAEWSSLHAVILALESSAATGIRLGVRLLVAQEEPRLRVVEAPAPDQTVFLRSEARASAAASLGPSPTLDEWYRAWAPGHAINRSPKSVATDESDYRRRIAPTFADRPLASITANDLRDWQRQTADTGLSLLSQQRIWRQLRTMFWDAEQAGVLKRDPSRRVRDPS
jgi:hypothetical protein